MMEVLSRSLTEDSLDMINGLYKYIYTHIHKLSSFRAEFQEDNLEDILIDKIINFFFFSSNVLSILKLTSDSITRILKNNP